MGDTAVQKAPVSVELESLKPVSVNDRAGDNRVVQDKKQATDLGKSRDEGKGEGHDFDKENRAANSGLNVKNGRGHGVTGAEQEKAANIEERKNVATVENGEGNPISMQALKVRRWKTRKAGDEGNSDSKQGVGGDKEERIAKTTVDTKAEKAQGEDGGKGGEAKKQLSKSAARRARKLEEKTQGDDGGKGGEAKKQLSKSAARRARKLQKRFGHDDGERVSNMKENNNEEKGQSEEVDDGEKGGEATKPMSQFSAKKARKLQKWNGDNIQDGDKTTAGEKTPEEKGQGPKLDEIEEGDKQEKQKSKVGRRARTWETWTFKEKMRRNAEGKGDERGQQRAENSGENGKDQVDKQEQNAANSGGNGNNDKHQACDREKLAASSGEKDKDQGDDKEKMPSGSRHNGKEDDDDVKDEDEGDDLEIPLSKNARKRAMKEEWWVSRKKMMKAAEKAKRQVKNKRKREEWEEKLSLMTEEQQTKLKEDRLLRRKERMEEGTQKREKLKEALTSGQNYVIDLEFADRMTPSEIRSLIQQVMHSYGANSRADHPGRLTLTGVSMEIKEALEKISGFKNWMLHREEQSYMEVFKDRTADLVYLTADSDNVLKDIDPTKIYIVGGLVDRNRWKKLTLEKAEKQGIATAKIPVGNYLKLTSSQVLTVNQVVELMLGFQKLKDWKEALQLIVPQRKRAAEESLEKGDAEEKSVEKGNAEEKSLEKGDAEEDQNKE